MITEEKDSLPQLVFPNPGIIYDICNASVKVNGKFATSISTDAIGSFITAFDKRTHSERFYGLSSESLVSMQDITQSPQELPISVQLWDQRQFQIQVILMSDKSSKLGEVYTLQFDQTKATTMHAMIVSLIGSERTAYVKPLMALIRPIIPTQTDVNAFCLAATLGSSAK